MTVLRNHWQLLALLAALVVLWQTPVVTPLKILIVFLHELSHAIAVWITGGDVLNLSITPDQGGHVLSRGGNRFITLSAGYLGSLLIGLALLLAAVRTTADRLIAAILGATLLGVAAFYVRDGFALLFCLAGGALLLLAARFLPRDVSDLALRTVGLGSMIYVPLDIISDTITRAHLRSDARMLAEEIGGATLLWGGLWLAISVAVIAASLRYGLGPNSNITLPKRLR